ncbi:hypothetical protein [Halalkalibacter okhensis]|uniref:Uncharacterized protein n=1 Tax=Halalkalibacter okhensis TaxID=333138 RepID=A0A0B0IDM4_9BACI|nr:hypothetical protein [Halalkalibacter okhensis]KHF40703.1 hypothetical protein LQ50_07880 [Halalkalibacter okhensis]
MSNNNNENSILFGAGELFVLPDSVDLDESTEEEIEEAMLKIGESSGESTLNYTQEFYDVRGGVGNDILASFVTSEEVMFNAGVCTLDMKVLNEISSTYYNEDESKRTLGIGGKRTVPVKQMLFVHTKRQDGKKLKLKMYRAQNRSGLQLTFNPTAESVFNFEFKLLSDPSKTNGNIVKIVEEI